MCLGAAACTLVRGLRSKCLSGDMFSLTVVDTDIKKTFPKANLRQIYLSSSVYFFRPRFIYAIAKYTLLAFFSLSVSILKSFNDGSHFSEERNANERKCIQ